MRPFVLAGATDNLPDLGGLELLTDVERARAACFVFERDRRDFIAAHVLVRRCAARILGVPTASLTVLQHCDHCGPGHGRPYLAQSPELGISLSHTRGYVCVAAGPGRVGVDAQWMPPGMLSLAARCLAPAERIVITDNAALTRQWVRKEALIKRGELTLEGMPSLDLSTLPTHLPGAPRRLEWQGRHLLEWLTSQGVAVTVMTDSPALTTTVAEPD